jgi:integrase
MAYTGLDLSAALNLRRSNIDFKNNVVRIWRKKTAHNNPTSQEIDLAISEQAMGALKSRIRVGQLGDDRVFDISGQAFQKTWKRARDKSSVEWHVRVKDLRHFFGSFLLNLGGVTPLIIAKFMGHKDVKMLLERYGHFTNETKQKAIQSFNKCTHNVRTEMW